MPATLGPAGRPRTTPRPAPARARLASWANAFHHGLRTVPASPAAGRRSARAARLGRAIGRSESGAGYAWAASLSATATTPTPGRLAITESLTRLNGRTGRTLPGNCERAPAEGRAPACLGQE